MTRRERSREPAREPSLFDDDEADVAPRITPAHWLQLVAGSVRRRWALALGVFVAVMAAAALYYREKPATYRVEAKILAQRQLTILSGSRSGDEHPARTAWELIHRRDNLVALVQQTGLLGGPIPDERPGVLARLLALLRPPEVEVKEEPVDALVRALDRRLLVTVEDGTILLQVDWPDARQAHQLAQAALQGFLEARHLQEVTAIDDVIAQMEGRSAKLKADLDAAVEAARRRAPAAARAAAPRERQASEELVRLRSLSEAKARAARDVEEFRARRLAELESQLAQARATLSEAHPSVIAVRRDIEALGRDSPQLRALREEERKARADYTAQLAREGYPGTPAAAEAAPPPPLEGGGPRDEDPKVRDLRLQYEQLASRVTAARIDLDAARAAFKYRYNVIWPPEIPSEARSPDPRKIFGGGLLAALLLAVLAAALPDLLAGRVVERWQVEQELDLPVLAETPRGIHRR